MQLSIMIITFFKLKRGKLIRITSDFMLCQGKEIDLEVLFRPLEN